MIGRILFTVAVVAVAAPLYAQTATPNIDARQEKQEKRIQQGVQSGELTQKEAGRLERQQAHIEADKEKAKADGVVTKQEREKLHREQDRASKHIKKEKHDAQKAH